MESEGISVSSGLITGLATPDAKRTIRLVIRILGDYCRLFAIRFQQASPTLQ